MGDVATNVLTSEIGRTSTLSAQPLAACARRVTLGTAAEITTQGKKSILEQLVLYGNWEYKFMGVTLPNAAFWPKKCFPNHMIGEDIMNWPYIRVAQHRKLTYAVQSRKKA
ncbi:hypothetical protein WN51_01858 [Melipona quadrifasciata]|uniref:Uncharacterized protein n=1 Tax=Melipona quadrifasciata TaxID=166423 RepID=A0A0N0U4S0_9HYME|nr:hypothetical protein WN51_01858 [Melipona quadrifasciata]